MAYVLLRNCGTGAYDRQIYSQHYVLIILGIRLVTATFISIGHIQKIHTYAESEFEVELSLFRGITAGAHPSAGQCPV